MGKCLGLLVFSADQFQERYKRSVSKMHFTYKNERDSCENHNDNLGRLKKSLKKKMMEKSTIRPFTVRKSRDVF